jgi:hypothetical protein
MASGGFSQAERAAGHGATSTLRNVRGAVLLPDRIVYARSQITPGGSENGRKGHFSYTPGGQ